MLFGQHALMKDSDDTDAVFLGPIEHDMTPMLHAHQPGTDGVAISSQSRPIGKLLQAGLKVAKVTFTLFSAPVFQGVFKDGFQVGFG